MPQPAREVTARRMKRILTALRLETTDPEQQIKILMNCLGLVISRSPYDNPDDIKNLSGGLISYVVAYRNDSGDYTI